MLKSYRHEHNKDLDKQEPFLLIIPPVTITYERNGRTALKCVYVLGAYFLQQICRHGQVSAHLTSCRQSLASPFTQREQVWPFCRIDGRVFGDLKYVSAFRWLLAKPKMSPWGKYVPLVFVKCDCQSVWSLRISKPEVADTLNSVVDICLFLIVLGIES